MNCTACITDDSYPLPYCMCDKRGVTPRLEVRDFRSVIDEAQRLHNPSKRFVLYSGGNDSGALLHAVWTAGLCDGAVHINTGTGIPETRKFVGEFCERYGIPLLEYFPPVPYREIVLKHGFPGPGSHRFMYIWLKERAIGQLIREHKTKWNDRIMLITGVRLSESKRRMGHVEPIVRQKTRLWVAPILDWTSDDLRDYRNLHGVPESEVAALLHMSGECLCGAFAHPDEIKDLEAFYPPVAARIHALEAEAKAAGVHCVWGTRPPKDRMVLGIPGMLCTSCEQLEMVYE